MARVKECLTYETNIDTVVAEKMLQFKLPAAHCVRIPAGEAQDFTSLSPSRECCHVRLQKNDGFRDSGRASCPCGEGGDGRKEPTSQLHTCMDWKVIEVT